MKPEFVHLHMHSEYSVLDGASRHEDMIKKVKDLGMNAVAQTDHGNLFGAIEFYQTAKAQGIKPIIGCEIYVSPGSRLEKKSHNIKEASYHLILLARDKTGYQNLMKLASIGYLEGFYYRPRVDKEMLQKHAQGLIALSSCLKGEVNYLFLEGKEHEARKAAGEYSEIFGKNGFYLELQDHGIPDQKKANRWLMEQSKKQAIALIATNDCHYVHREDHDAHDALLCIQTGNMLQDQDRMRFYNDQFFIKSPQEMAEKFKDVPDALRSTLEVAEQCNLELLFNQMHLPQYIPPQGMTQPQYLRHLCEKGLQKRYAEPKKEIRERLEFELRTIEEMKFVSYFLIVWDFIQYAKKNDIPVGPGRGSAAGSLVAYLLEITDIDPLAYGLIFERFLNPSRISMPDIDIDFCDEKRGEVIEYVAKKYGSQNVAQIITFGTLGAKAVVRDVGRVMGRPYAEVDRIAKLIPFGPKITLKDALEMEPQLKKIYEEEETVKQIIDKAYKLEGMVRNVSTHAAGIVISEKPLSEFVPLYRGTGGEITTQYPMEAIEKIGLLKMDFLGLKTLTVIHDTLKIIERTQNFKVDIEKIALDDPKTFSLLNQANTAGVFQLESAGMRDLSKRIGISRFEDIIALIALFRPGPMHMVEDFIGRKHGKVKVQYDHPLLETILKETYGIMLYQEQVMTVAKVMANFTLAQADNLRKIMGKKIEHQMKEQKNIFIQGCLENKIPKTVAEKVFELMAYFAGYGFNKSHSAAYALIAYRTACLKANYPVEYMTALLSSEVGNTDKLVKYINECKDMGIQILPPDVNESFQKFTVVGNAIRFGLAAVKNVGEAVVQSIIEERAKGDKFLSFQDFLHRVDSKVANRKVLESLIKCGAFDSLNVRRSQLMDVLDHAIDSSFRHRQDQLKGQSTLFSLFGETAEASQISFPDIPEWEETKILTFEKELLGFYVTGHPLNRYKDELGFYRTDTMNSLLSRKDGDEVVLGVIVNKVQLKTTKRGERMAIIYFEDLEGMIEAVVYPKVFEKISSHIQQDFLGFVEGRIEMKEDHPKLIVNDLVKIEDAYGRYAKSIHIQMQPDKASAEDLQKLREELTHEKGECPVYISFSFPNGGKVVISTSSDFKVQPTPKVIHRLKEIFGDEAVVIKRNKLNSSENRNGFWKGQFRNRTLPQGQEKANSL
jgi:DNA polymerase-3 subunit alpha